MGENKTCMNAKTMRRGPATKNRIQPKKTPRVKCDVNEGRNQPQIERYRILQVSSCKIKISFPCAFLADLAPSSLGLPVTRREKISLSCTRSHEESSMSNDARYAFKYSY